MSCDPKERDIAIRAQRRMFRLARRDYELDRRTLHAETGIPEATLKSWGCSDSDKVLFAVMPLTGIRALIKVIPDELSSLLLTGTDKHFGTDECGDDDLSALECEASGVVHEIAKAKRDGKITPQERARIADATRRMVPVARAVAR